MGKIVKRIVLIAFVLLSLAPVLSWAREISPLVSPGWLAANLQKPNLVILDIRKVEEYKAGHVPKAVNVFYGSWAIKKADLDNELPDGDDLDDIINSAGINDDSLIVIVGKTETTPDLVNTSRVAWTLKYAGLENVAILDGGYAKWIAENREISTESVKVTGGNFKAKWNKDIYADKNYIEGKIGKATIVDARGPEFFFGVAKLDFVAKAGHIPQAVNLPSAWLFTKEGTFKNKDELKAMAKGVVGENINKEIIAYCDTGRLASAAWFLFSEILGYKNVRLYDGSMQEWAKDAKAPVVRYSWQ